MHDRFPRCQVVPLAGHQVAVVVDGRERLRWHFGGEYPRPFFFPVVGPSGAWLTRMGHPGAPNHDHHRSLWVGHAKVLGIDFWADTTPARIRQKHWLAYHDGDEAVLAMTLGWRDGHDPRDLLEQELVVGVRPGDDGELQVELQSRFRPQSDSLEFGQTNFGFLAVRVAKSISAHFGGGELTNSDGQRGEPAIFGKPATWMDYSGPVQTPEGKSVIEGIAYFDHPSNPGQPTSWHVREDGWMCASPCLNGPLTTTKANPLTLRYMLLLHRGEPQRDRFDGLRREFADRPRFEVVTAAIKHQQFRVRRVE